MKKIIKKIKLRGMKDFWSKTLSNLVTGIVILSCTGLVAYYIGEPQAYQYQKKGFHHQFELQQRAKDNTAAMDVLASIMEIAFQRLQASGDFYYTVKNFSTEKEEYENDRSEYKKAKSRWNYKLEYLRTQVENYFTDRVDTLFHRKYECFVPNNIDKSEFNSLPISLLFNIQHAEHIYITRSIENNREPELDRLKLVNELVRTKLFNINNKLSNQIRNNNVGKYKNKKLFDY